jgi:hypothetical protein
VLYADRLGTVFEKARFVNNQDRVWIAELLHHVGTEVIADGIGIPVCGVA